MRLAYRFNEKTDPENYKWGMSAEVMLKDYVSMNRSNYNEEPAEQRLNRLTGAVGGLADVLISKGLLTPQEFIEAIGASFVYEVRPNRIDF